MSDIPEQENQVVEAQTQVGGNEEVANLQSQIQLLAANNQKLLSEKKNQAESMAELQRQVAELQSNQSQAKQAKLAEAGEWKTLYDDLKKTYEGEVSKVSELQRQLADKETAYQQQTIKARAMSAFQQAGVQQSDHMYALLADKFRMSDEGEVVAMDGGVQKPINDYLGSLKNPESQFAYMFQGSGARGMSAVGSTPSASNGMANPYITNNFTEIVRLEAEDSDLAARLRQQAGK